MTRNSSQDLRSFHKKNNFGISLVRKNKIKHKQTKQQTPNRSAFSGKKNKWKRNQPKKPSTHLKCKNSPYNSWLTVLTDCAYGSPALVHEFVGTFEQTWPTIFLLQKEKPHYV